jgi:uncharacterized membrane protein YeaQ/YmgE (transglycosylase-associated protein family)
MSKAHLVSLVTFLLFAIAGLGLGVAFKSPLGAIGTFVIVGLVGAVIAGRLFDWLATPEEKQRDLEDRVRNSDL